MFTSSNIGCNKWPTLLLRFHSLIWASFGLGVDGCAGRLVGGCENGTITVYSPDVILAAGEEAIVGQSTKHTGPVRALDYNPFQVSTNSLLSVEWWFSIHGLNFNFNEDSHWKKSKAFISL